MVSLALFVAWWCKDKDGEYQKRTEAKIIRYRNYDMVELNEYKQEMVLFTGRSATRKSKY